MRGLFEKVAQLRRFCHQQMRRIAQPVHLLGGQCEGRWHAVEIGALRDVLDAFETQFHQVDVELVAIRNRERRFA